MTLKLPQIKTLEQLFGDVGVAALPGELLTVAPGDTVRVTLQVDYRGPAIPTGAEVRCAFGKKGITFDEVFYVQRPVEFLESSDFLTHTITCDLLVPNRPYEGYDLYATIRGVPGPDIFTPYLYNVLEVIGIEEYEEVQHTVSHFAYIYEGDAEVTTITLRTHPFRPADWVPEKFIAELEREARESGVRILETKVYVDTSPLFWTDYRIEVTGRPPPVTEGVGVGAFPAIPLFVKIILTALAIAFGIFVISWVIEQAFSGIFQRKPGLETVKQGWGKEALILDIQDSEEFWERTPTPLATLEEMSEAELRDHLDKIAEEEVPPPEVGWLPLVAIGAVGVIGVGLAMAMAPRERP